MAFPKKAPEERHVKQTISLPPQLLDRLIKFCQSEERTMSWVIQKALDEWLKNRGF